MLSWSDVFDLADAFAAPGSIRVTLLSGRELVKTACFVASSTFELHRVYSGAVAADHLVEDLLVAHLHAFAQPEHGIIQTVVGEVGGRAESRTSLAPNTRGRQSVFG